VVISDGIRDPHGFLIKDGDRKACHLEMSLRTIS
jgi:hypothetical protein